MTDLIFMDGFESGDTGAWSSVVGGPTPEAVPPVVVIETPVDTTTSALIVDVSGTATDASPVGEVRANGEILAFDGSRFTGTILLATGANTVTVEATDRWGNVGSASVAVTTVPETTPPTLAILAPESGFFLGNQPQIEVAFADDDAGIDEPSLAFTANGVPFAAGCSPTADGALCLPVAPLSEGFVSLVASIRDRALNTATATASFTVDTVGVVIDVTSPAEGTVTQADDVTVTGTFGPGIATIAVSGVAAALSGGGFSATVPIEEGMNVLVAHATKANGNSGSASVEVTRDTTAPVVAIQTPRDGLVAVDDTIAVTGLVNDTVSSGAPPRIFVNGLEAFVSNGSFMLLDLEIVPGPNVIEVVATDAAGNEDRDSVTVQLQNAAGAKLRIATGNGQFGMVNEAVAQPLSIEVTDGLGNPVAGRVVTFEVTRNSGVLSSPGGGEATRRLQAVTNGAGQAAALLTLGDTVGEGNNRVRVTGVGVAGEAEFCASGLAAFPDKILAVEGGNQRGQTGTPLRQPLEALVVDRDGNPIPNLDVTFEVLEGTGTLDGVGTLVVATGNDGVARAVLTLGPMPGLNNNLVRASFEGLAGLSATFTSSGLAAGDPALTELAGVLLDNAQEAIPGATVTIEGTLLETTTDAEGQFLLSGVPVGDMVLHLDPSTSPRPEEFPPFSFETVTVAGQRNTLGKPILIPTLDMTSAKIVGGPEDVTLTMERVDGLELTVFANSVTFPDGATSGLLTISQVHLDKVPMTPPNGTIFMPPAWTIQPAGVRFDPPAKIKLPNNGLPSGKVITIFQFDHDLNGFVSMGKGAVSEDGRFIVSDGGFGIVVSGWGGGAPPPPPSGNASNSSDPLSDPGVNKEFDRAWQASNPGSGTDPNRKEQGGWIVRNPDGTLSFDSWPPGQAAGITPTNPPTGTAGSFHTHPNTGSGWEPKPSTADVNWVKGDPGVRAPHYVISEKKIYRINKDGTVDEVKPRK